MNITEINQAINKLEQKFTAIKSELDQCKKLSGAAFAFTANWRDKASYEKRIPILQKQLTEVSDQILPLRAARALEMSRIEEEKKKEQIRIVEKNKIVNPLQSLDI